MPTLNCTAIAKFGEHEGLGPNLDPPDGRIGHSRVSCRGKT